MIDAAGHTLPASANIYNLGSAAFDWKGGFIRSAWTVTSDATLKRQLHQIAPNEVSAGKRIIAELRWWQWLDSVANIGKENARRHFGPMAQDMAKILIEEGVEIDPKGSSPSFVSDMIGWDEWPEISEPVISKRTVQHEVIITLPVDGTDDGTGQPLLRREVQIQEQEEDFDTGERRNIRSAGSGYRIDPTQVSFFLIAAMNADFEARIAVLEKARSRVRRGQ